MKEIIKKVVDSYWKMHLKANKHRFENNFIFSFAFLLSKLLM